MKRSDGLKEKRLLILFILLSLIPIWVAWELHEVRFFDDSLITLTYAKNIARGDGFVFNHPPPVLGTTTPLYALIIAGLAVLFPFLKITTLAIFFSACCWMGIVWLIYLFRNTLGLSDPQAALLGSILILAGWVRYLSFETFLFAFLLFFIFCLLCRRNSLSAGFLCALLFLTRGEGILVFLIGFAWVFFLDIAGRKKGEKMQVIRFSAGFLIPWVIWSLYAYVTFGNIFPNTLSVKVAQGQSGLWELFLPSLFKYWMPKWASWFGSWPFSWLNLWYIFILLGLVHISLRNRKWLFFPAWMAAYAGGYTFLGVSGYHWYKIPVYFVLLILFFSGLLEIFLWTERLRPKFRMAILAPVIAGMLFCLARPMVSEAMNHEMEERDRVYMKVADWLKSNSRRKESIAYMEIGYIGFYSENRVLDLVGLVSSDMAENVAKGDFVSAFWRELPDYFLYLEGSLFLKPIFTDSRFNTHYQMIHRFPKIDRLALNLYRKIDYP